MYIRVLSQHRIFGPKIWVQIHSEIQNKKFIVGFKWETKKWKPTDCPNYFIDYSNFFIAYSPYSPPLKNPVSSILGQFKVQKWKPSGFQNAPLTFGFHVSYLPHEAVLSE